MTWQGRDLPSNWSTIRRQRFTLDNWTCVDCGLHDPTGRLLECDHIGHPNDHRLDSLRTRCTDLRKGGNGCHHKHTEQQRQAGIAQLPTTRRQPERHPGLR